MAQGIDSRLRRIEHRLGLDEEDIIKELAKVISLRLDSIDRNIRELRRKVFGDEPNQGATVTAEQPFETEKRREW